MKKIKFYFLFLQPYLPATCDRIRSVTTHRSSLFDGNSEANTKLPSCSECKACARSARDAPNSRIFVNAKREI